MNNRYPCLCCDYLTRGEPPNGSYEICPVCFWEDDPVQSEDHAYSGGANTLSLNESRENFKKYGATEKRFIQSVRKPYEDEILEE